MALEPTYVRRKNCLPLYICVLNSHVFGVDDYRTCTKICNLYIYNLNLFDILVLSFLLFIIYITLTSHVFSYTIYDILLCIWVYAMPASCF